MDAVFWTRLGERLSDAEPSTVLANRRGRALDPDGLQQQSRHGFLERVVELHR